MITTWNAIILLALFLCLHFLCLYIEQWWRRRRGVMFCPWCGDPAIYYDGVVDCEACEVVTEVRSVT
jgi:hypothetical protein